MDHVKSFLDKHNLPGSTEVCSETAAPVTQENVVPHTHTETQEAVDRERHVHHHQHRVLPVHHKETLPTEHEYVAAPAVTRESKHDMLPEHKEKLQAQQTLHQNTTTTGETQHTTAATAAAANEHVHHHVHETIQPVISKETHQQKHVHHTQPVHEIVHDAPVVHEHTILPSVSMDEFKNKIGGAHSHTSDGHQHAFYQGQPKVGGAAEQTA